MDLLVLRSAAVVTSHGDRPSVPQQTQRSGLDPWCFKPCDGVSRGNRLFVRLKLGVCGYMEVERRGWAAVGGEAASA